MQVLPTIRTHHVELVRMRAEADEIVITLMMTAPIAQCPNCQQWSQSIHSRYVRHLSDLPWGGDTPDCCHYYFTERVPEIAPPYRRCTNRFQDWLSTLAMAFGGGPAARVLGNLGLQVSGDTCLRLIPGYSQRFFCHTTGLGCGRLGTVQRAVLWYDPVRSGTTLCDRAFARPGGENLLDLAGGASRD